MINKLLERQLKKAARPDGSFDWEAFLQLVLRTYEEYDHTLRLQDNATQLMSDELNELNAALRRERDEVVAEFQKRFELAVNSANDGIWDWRVKEDVFWLSERCKTMLGYAEEQLKSGHISDWYGLLYGPDEEKARDFIAECLANHSRNISITLRFRHLSGDIHHIMCRAAGVVDSSGQVTRLVGVHTDITDLMAIQEELKAAHSSIEAEKERAERASQAKSDFLANMSHELRTPLNGILGMTRLLLETHLADAQKELAGTVFKSSVNLLEIVNDILDLSKIEAGEMQLERIGFDAPYIFESVSTVVGHLAREKNLPVRVIYDKAAFPYLLGDPLRVTRVLTNLLGNAIKYTDKGHVELRAFCKRLDEGRVELRCEIEDTGVGIPLEKQKSVFEKFVQADTSTTRRYGGTGLGLAITKQLVEMMGGRIGLESVVGKGSTFWFTIPFETTQELTGEKHLRRQKRTMGVIAPGDAHILIAEDHPINQIFITKLMEKFGVKNFEIADNGRLAFEKYDLRPWSVILMDCHMPELNGYDTTLKIRDHEKKTGRHVPIVAMTANAMVGEKEKCLRYGMDDYISKPINMDEMQDILGQWLDFSNHGVILAAAPPAQDKISRPPAVDLTPLKAFAEGDEKMELQLIEAFLCQSEKNIETLKESCANGDSVAWREAAHMLKGGSLYIGASILSDLCNRGQHFMGTQEERAQLLQDIRTEYGLVTAFLGKECAKKT